MLESDFPTPSIRISRRRAVRIFDRVAFEHHNPCSEHSLSKRADGSGGQASRPAIKMHTPARRGACPIAVWKSVPPVFPQTLTPSSSNRLTCFESIAIGTR